MRQIKFRAWNDVHYIMLDACSIEQLLTEHPLSKASVGELTLLQFTGLKDINQVEIYEGDIIECWGRNLSIKWEDSDASFFAESIDGNIYESGQEWSGNCKVIGNIYQNKGLLDEQ